MKHKKPTILIHKQVEWKIEMLGIMILIFSLGILVSQHLHSYTHILIIIGIGLAFFGFYQHFQGFIYNFFKSVAQRIHNYHLSPYRINGHILTLVILLVIMNLFLVAKLLILSKGNITIAMIAQPISDR